MCYCPFVFSVGCRTKIQLTLQYMKSPFYFLQRFVILYDILCIFIFISKVCQDNKSSKNFFSFSTIFFNFLFFRSTNLSAHLYFLFISGGSIYSGHAQPCRAFLPIPPAVHFSIPHFRIEPPFYHQEKISPLSVVFFGPIPSFSRNSHDIEYTLLFQLF